MKQITEKEMWLEGQEDGIERHLEEEEFKANQEQRLKVQREKIQKKRRLEREKLLMISKSEEIILLAGLTGGKIEDLEVCLTDEDMRLKLKEEGRKKLNTENKRKKRLADKVRLEEIQEKEEVVADVLEACIEIGKGESGNNDDCNNDEMVVEDAVEYISSLKLGISLKDLQFREKLGRQKVLYKERTRRMRRMRAQRKEMYGCEDGRKRTC